MAPQLAIVVAVLEEEHVTRAAERLGVPQPTVSATMRRLGDVIGTPLVQPWGRGIVATAAGRALLPAAREALMTLRAARHELQDVIDPDKGLVALGFLHTLGVRDVPRLLDASWPRTPTSRSTSSKDPRTISSTKCVPAHWMSSSSRHYPTTQTDWNQSCCATKSSTSPGAPITTSLPGGHSSCGRPPEKPTSC